MSLGRLNEIEDIINSGIKRSNTIVYGIDDITKLLELVDKERSIQDRSVYSSAYYVKNKQKMDNRAKEWYAKNKKKRRSI